MKILITEVVVKTSVKGNDYARISFVNLTDGSTFSGFVDPSVVKGITPVDLSELSALADEAEFDQRGRVVRIGQD